MSKYSYAQEKETVLQQNPSNSLPPLQVCQEQCPTRGAHLTYIEMHTSLASPDLRWMGKGKPNI